MFGEEGMEEGRGQSRGRYEYVKGKKDFGMFFVHCAPLEDTGIFLFRDGREGNLWWFGIREQRKTQQGCSTDTDI